MPTVSIKAFFLSTQWVPSTGGPLSTALGCLPVESSYTVSCVVAESSYVVSCVATDPHGLYSL